MLSVGFTEFEFSDFRFAVELGPWFADYCLGEKLLANIYWVGFVLAGWVAYPEWAACCGGCSFCCAAVVLSWQK